MADGSNKGRDSYMTDDASKRVDGYLTKLEQNRSNMNPYYTEWEKVDEAYANNQEVKDNRPNSRVNIMNANIEGQVSALVEQNLAISCRGEGPSDDKFAGWGEIGLDWVFRQNKIKRLLRSHELRREKFGYGVMKVGFDPDAANGYGMPTINCVPPHRFFVDMKVTDIECWADAGYMCEVIGPYDVQWAIDEYGEVANNINAGLGDRSLVFRKDVTEDDEDAFFLIQWWSMPTVHIGSGKDRKKRKGIRVLRLEEFSDDGVLLYDSFEDKGEVPFYRYNKYPYFLTNLYTEEGKLLGFGDGKLLRPLQDMINKLYDQIILQARPSRVLLDPASELDPEMIDDGDMSALPCNDPNQNSKVIQLGQVNPALFQILDRMHQEVQRVTRFSELMMGQRASSNTATEAAIQQQQGNSSVDHKKLMLQETLVDVCKYLLDLMMEKYDGGRSFPVAEDKDEYIWIDFRQMDSVPRMIPASDGFVKDYMAQNADSEPPRWMQLQENGEGITKSVDLDIEINIGAGLPKNKAFLFEMIKNISQLRVLAQDGVEKPLLFWEELRKFFGDFLGFPIDDDMALMPQPALPSPQIAGQQPGMPAQPLPSADVTGLTPAMNPAMNQLPQQPQVGGVM